MLYHRMIRVAPGLFSQLRGYLHRTTLVQTILLSVCLRPRFMYVKTSLPGDTANPETIEKKPSNLSNDLSTPNEKPATSSLTRISNNNIWSLATRLAYSIGRFFVIVLSLSLSVCS